MSEVPLINSEESLRNWLENRPPSERAIISIRVALRAAPVWLGSLAQGWARDAGLTPLPLLRLLLASTVVQKSPEVDLRRAMHAALAATRSGVDAAIAGGFAAIDAATTASEGVSVNGAIAADKALSAARHVVQATDTDLSDSTQANAAASRCAAVGVLAASYANFASRPATWAEIQRDVQILQTGHQLETVPLWQALASEGEGLMVAQSILRSTQGGDFWIDWYQRALDGRPQNWSLLRDVALIDDKLWEQGGDTLDLEIKRLVEQHRLLNEVRRLKAELIAASASAVAHRGHNNPPELIDAASVEISSAVLAISEQLDAAEQELQESSPSPTRLRQIGAALMDAVVTVLDYCVSLGDSAVKEAAKTAGKAAGVAGVAYLTGHGDRLTALAKGLIEFAKSLL